MTYKYYKHLPALVLCTITVWPTGNVLGQSYEQGRSAYLNADYTSALKILRPLAESGDADAQKLMGIMYDYGQGVPQNPELALQWYKRSAEQGLAPVQYQVGSKYYKGEHVTQDYAEAARWWELAAEGGQVDAQFNLGLMYFRGIGVTQNDQKAAELFLQAAGQDHGQAQYSIAVMYAFGRGVEKNHDTARQWFQKSAEKGIAQAQYNLGLFYENGYGVNKDILLAEEWYQRAANQGLPEAQNKLDRLYDEVVTADQQAESTITPGPVQITATTTSDYQQSEVATHQIRREQWLLQQSEKNYTLQIGSVTNEPDLINFLRKHNIEDNAAYIQLVIDGTTRYNAFYGVYESYAEAESAIATLPPAVRQVKPWIRNFGILQRMLD